MAMVPLLLISTKVMMAISSKGTSLPWMLRANTTLASGHGMVAAMRMVM